jgi:hypothetical protein
LVAAVYRGFLATTKEKQTNPQSIDKPQDVLGEKHVVFNITKIRVNLRA